MIGVCINIEKYSGVRYRFSIVFQSFSWFSFITRLLKMNHFYYISFVLATLIVSIQSYPGGPSKIDPKNQTFLRSLLKVENEMNRKLHAEHIYHVTKVFEAYSQVVAGIKYTAELEFRETDCNRDEQPQRPSSSCRLTERALRCHVEIWSQPWLHKDQLTKFECDNMIGLY